MLDRLSRPAALALIVLLLAIAGWCLAAPKPRVVVATKATPYTDTQLYLDIVDRVADGTPYHRAATELQRQHNFPTRPFVTVRPPALATVAATLGWPVLRGVAFALLAAAVVAWFRALQPRLGAVQSGSMALALLIGGASLAQPRLLAMHEIWAGLFLTLALAAQFSAPRRWPLALLCAGCALALRELALPFVLLGAAFAMAEKQWRALAGWAALLALFAAYMVWHAAEISAFALPTDRASPSWEIGLRPAVALNAVIHSSILQTLSPPLERLLAALPLLGWLALPGRSGLFARAWFGGFALMLALFARADNFYWAEALLPAYFAGFALVPAALVQLFRGLSRPAR